jgi:hypothetical protein
MRVEYKIELDTVETPSFAVEAVEGIGKLFTLATLVINILESKAAVEIIFHGLSREDPERRIESFKAILATSTASESLRYVFGESGQVPGSSSAFQWLTVSRS